ncbi:MAG: cupin domain-containing protein [Myxococcota bacterium]
MKIKKLKETKIMKNAHGVDARNLYKTKDAMVTIITLQPGQALRPHITPVDVAFYLLEGEGVVQIGEEKQTLGPNTLIESPKDILHCWFNESDSPLKFMVIKAPKPTKPTTLIDGKK